MAAVAVQWHLAEALLVLVNLGASLRTGSVTSPRRLLTPSQTM